jgi:hypothetical protein
LLVDYFDGLAAIGGTTEVRDQGEIGAFDHNRTWRRRHGVPRGVAHVALTENKPWLSSPNAVASDQSECFTQPRTSYSLTLGLAVWLLDQSGPDIERIIDLGFRCTRYEKVRYRSGGPIAAFIRAPIRI